MAVTYFRHGFITKEMVLNMWFAMARTHFKYFVCQTNDGVGTSVPIGFGPWGNFRLAWGNPVCHWDGVTSGCLG